MAVGHCKQGKVKLLTFRQQQPANNSIYSLVLVIVGKRLLGHRNMI